MTDPNAHDLIQRLADELEDFYDREYGWREDGHGCLVIEEARAYLAANSEPAADGAAVPNPLAQQALEALEAMATMAANGQQLTIAPDWDFGTATLIDSNGAHTHVGGDWENSREANLELFVQAMHQQLVHGAGLSWVRAHPEPAADGPAVPESREPASVAEQPKPVTLTVAPTKERLGATRDAG